MKKAALILISVALCGASFLTGCNPSRSKDAATPVNTGSTLPPAVAGALKIAYVNTDTLEANYELLKSKRTEFNSRQEQMEGELQRSYQQMQNDASEVQKKAQSNTLSQTEYETAQKRLMQMQQSLETRKQSLTEQLMKEQDQINKDLKTRLDAFLAEYNKSKHYDFILSFAGAGSPVLYANKQLDITKEVVDGMNADARNDAAKKK